jgi:hemerythrin
VAAIASRNAERYHPWTSETQELDRDHAELQALAGAFAAAQADRRVALDVLEALRGHAAAHFAFEDEELRKLGGPDMQCHLDEHAAVLASLAQVRDVLADSATPLATVERLVQSLSAELLRWLPSM